MHRGLGFLSVFLCVLLRFKIKVSINGVPEALWVRTRFSEASLCNYDTGCSMHLDFSQRWRHVEKLSWSPKQNGLEFGVYSPP